MAMTIAMAVNMAGTTPVMSQHVRGCEPAAVAARNGSEDDRAAVRTYANGAVRFAVIDLGEPSVTPFHLKVQFPVAGDPDHACRLVSARADGAGFASLDLRGAASRYDPSIGLTVTIPALLQEGSASRNLELTINQALGSLLVRLEVS